MNPTSILVQLRIRQERLKFHLYWFAPALFQRLSLFKFRLRRRRRFRRHPCAHLFRDTGIRGDGYCMRIRNLRVDRGRIDYDSNPLWPKLPAETLSVADKPLPACKRRLYDMPTWLTSAQRSKADGVFEREETTEIQAPVIAHLAGFDMHNPALCLRTLEQLHLYLHQLGMSTDQFTMLNIYAHPDKNDLPVSEIYRKFFPTELSVGDVAARRFTEFEDLRVFYASLNEVLLDRSPTSFERFRRQLFKRFELPEPQPFERARRALLIERNTYPWRLGQKPTSVRRRMSNTIELTEALDKAFPQLSVESVQLDQLSCVEQAQCLSNAQIIIGAHGAGLAQTPYFLPAGAGLLELFPFHYRKPHAVLLLRTLCRDASMRYMRWINRDRRRETGLEIPEDIRREMDANDPFYITEVPPPAIISKVRKLLSKMGG